MSWFHKHKWTKWEQYKQTMFYMKFPEKTFEQEMQKRRCEECGYEQRREVNAY